RPAAGARRSGSAFCSEPEDSLWSYGHRGVPGRLGRAAQDGFGEQRARGLRRDEGRLDVERVALEVRLEARERNAGLHEPLEHADVVGRPDIARRAQDDRARQPVAPPEELPVGGTVRLDAARRLRLRLIVTPQRLSHSRLVWMPVAIITTSQTMSPPAAKRSRLRPLASSILASRAPVRIATPCFASQPSTSVAPASSIMRGRMRGSISTIVSLAPRARIEFRIVKAMNPAPTMTTWLPRAISARTARASSRVQNEWTPRPSAPGTGARTAEEPVAIRQSSYSSVVPSSSVHALALASSAV